MNMINSFTTSNYSNLKGFIAETICEYHFGKLNYNVIPLGNEKISGLLPSIKTLFKDGIVKEGTYDSNTFSVLQGLTQHLPDFAIWKLAHNDNFHSKNAPTKNILKISFIEVKYRKEIDTKNTNFIVEKDKDELKLYKYISFIENKAKENNLEINEIEFYVYLITYDNESNKHLILFGKVLPNKENSYKVTLYKSVDNKFNSKTGYKWNDYNDLLNFLCLDNAKKINYLFNDNFIFSMKNKDELDVKKIIFQKLDEYK